MNHYMLVPIKQMALFVTLLLCPLIGFAQTEAGAKALLQSVVETTLNDLQENRELYEKDSKKIEGMVTEKLLPHIDTKVMSQLVLGKYWREATDAQKAEFQQNFQTMLISAYAKELVKYTDAVVEYGDATPIVKNRTKVNGRIRSPSGDKYDVLLSLAYMGDEWKAYDVSLDGVSFVASFRSSFYEMIEREGLDNVIKGMVNMDADMLEQR